MQELEGLQNAMDQLQIQLEFEKEKTQDGEIKAKMENILMQLEAKKKNRAKDDEVGERKWNQHP